jgi:cysteine-S-conjugate beta-lyase
MLTATTKTFNIAGGLTGNVIIPDAAASGAVPGDAGGLGHLAEPDRRADGDRGLCRGGALARRAGALHRGECAGVRRGRGSDPGRAVDAARGDLSRLGRLLGAPAWSEGEIAGRVERGARIAANHGPTFGRGGDGWMRFNIAMPRVRVEEAVRRLQAAFDDLQ